MIELLHSDYGQVEVSAGKAKACCRKTARKAKFVTVQLCFDFVDEENRPSADDELVDAFMGEAADRCFSAGWCETEPVFTTYGPMTWSCLVPEGDAPVTRYALAEYARYGDYGPLEDLIEAWRVGGEPPAIPVGWEKER